MSLDEISPLKSRRKFDHTLHARMSAEETAKMRALAKVTGQQISTMVRRAVRGYLDLPYDPKWFNRTISSHYPGHNTYNFKAEDMKRIQAHADTYLDGNAVSVLRSAVEWYLDKHTHLLPE
jgi:hypothetical protein